MPAQPLKARGLLLALVCAAAALSLPAGASAKAATEVHPGGYFLQVFLPQSNGYLLTITANDHRQIYLSARKGFDSVTYRVAGRASSRRLEADFGALGRIDLKLDLEPRRSGGGRRGKRCKGRPTVELAGRFSGTVDFPGEPGIVGVSAHRGSAIVRRSFRRVCEPPGLPGLEKNPLGLGMSVLAARAHETAEPLPSKPWARA